MNPLICKFLLSTGFIFNCRRNVKNESVIAVQVFDQTKFKKKTQGFLGVIDLQVSNVFNLEVGGDGKVIFSCAILLIALDRDVNTGFEEIQFR